MKIGEKIRRLRLRRGLTMQELADRTELSKGFISQLERDITSPSIVTLADILECLGTTPGDFFSDREEEKVVFGEEDMFEKEDGGQKVLWLVPNAQKNELEPILTTLSPGTDTPVDEPHSGEEFGYVLQGTGHLVLGERRYRLHKGSSFCFKPTMPHHIENKGRSELKILWVSTPPTF